MLSSLSSIVVLCTVCMKSSGPKWALSLMIIIHVVIVQGAFYLFSSFVYPHCILAHSCYNLWITDSTLCSDFPLLLLFRSYIWAFLGSKTTCLSPMSFMMSIVIQYKWRWLLTFLTYLITKKWWYFTVNCCLAWDWSVYIPTLLRMSEWINLLLINIMPFSLFPSLVSEEAKGFISDVSAASSSGYDI